MTNLLCGVPYECHKCGKTSETELQHEWQFSVKAIVINLRCKGHKLQTASNIMIETIRSTSTISLERGVPSFKTFKDFSSFSQLIVKGDSDPNQGHEKVLKEASANGNLT